MSLVTYSQLQIERKIVIENGKFYFVTYNEDDFKYRLHVGSIMLTISKAEQIELPWGSSLDFPLNQFMWDVYKDTFFCVNKMPHSLNDQTQNIKKISLSDLRKMEENKTSRDGYIFEGIDAFAFIENRGHKDILSNHIYQDTYFSDMCLDENGKMIYFTTIDSTRRWYKNDFMEYSSSKSVDNILSQPLLVDNGNAFLLNDKKIELSSKDGVLLMNSKSINCNLTANTLVIINKDQKNIYFFLDKEHIELPLPFSELLDKYGICNNNK